jgi:hypothetical protein
LKRFQSKLTGLKIQGKSILQNSYWLPAYHF